MCLRISLPFTHFTNLPLVRPVLDTYKQIGLHFNKHPLYTTESIGVFEWALAMVDIFLFDDGVYRQVRCAAKGDSSNWGRPDCIICIYTYRKQVLDRLL